MLNRRVAALIGLGLAGTVVLGGCADAPPGTAGTPVAATPTPTAQDRAPCTQRLRPADGAGPTLMALTPEARAEIERLRALTPEQQAAEDQATARDPQLAARLADVRERVERATRPCADR